MVTPILDFWVKRASSARSGGEGIVGYAFVDDTDLVTFKIFDKQLHETTLQTIYKRQQATGKEDLKQQEVVTRNAEMILLTFESFVIGICLILIFLIVPLLWCLYEQERVSDHHTHATAVYVPRTLFTSIMSGPYNNHLLWLA